jgi:anti-anti-sigma factor
VFSTEAPTLVSFGVHNDLRARPVRLVVHGELDLFTVSVLEDELASVERLGEPIVVDLSSLSFIDSGGVRALARARKRASIKGLRFAIIRCSAPVRRVFELTGMAHLLDEAVPELLEARSDG